MVTSTFKIVEKLDVMGHVRRYQHSQLFLIRRNKAKQAVLFETAAVADEKVDEKITHTFAFEDLTDKENPEFLYVV